MGSFTAASFAAGVSGAGASLAPGVSGAGRRGTFRPAAAVESFAGESSHDQPSSRGAVFLGS